MEELATGGFVGKFGLDLRLLIAQLVNFAIVLFVLSRFVFRPLLETMRKRSERIAKGLQEAEAAQREKEAVKAWELSERKRIQEEARVLLTRAEVEARTRRDALLQKAEEDAKAMHDRAAADAARMHDDALSRAKEDVGTLAVDVAERVLSKKLSSTDRSAYLQESLKEVEQVAKGSA